MEKCEKNVTQTKGSRLVKAIIDPLWYVSPFHERLKERSCLGFTEHLAFFKSPRT